MFRLFRRRNAYRVCFGGLEGQEVLRDLAKFCRADSPTFDPDARVHAYREGRREVFLRIKRMVRLTDDELADLLKQSEGE